MTLWCLLVLMGRHRVDADTDISNAVVCVCAFASTSRLCWPAILFNSKSMMRGQPSFFCSSSALLHRTNFCALWMCDCISKYMPHDYRVFVSWSLELQIFDTRFSAHNQTLQSGDWGIRTINCFTCVASYLRILAMSCADFAAPLLVYVSLGDVSLRRCDVLCDSMQSSNQFPTRNALLKISHQLKHI